MKGIKAGTPLADQDVSAVKDWAEAGMTLAIGPYFGPAAAETAKMRTILDAAHEKGIRVILADRRALWTNLTKKGEAEYRAECSAAIKDLGDHPAVFGYYVGDEPNAAAFSDACKAMRIQKELAPRLSPFINLLPWFNGAEKVVAFPTWSKYLDAYGRQARPDFLCFDCYAQCRPNPDTDGYSFEQYFRDLYEYREAAGRQGIPFWITILSVGHFDYRCPTEDLFRWQINTAVAHGAKGVLYLYMYNNVPPHAHENYRLAPIDEHGERTETFTSMSRVNRTFLRSVAPLLNDLAVRRVWRVGKAWGGFPLFDGKTATNRVLRIAASDATFFGDSVRVKFLNVGGGFVAPSGKMTSFELAGEDGKWVEAEAQVEGGTVVVSAPGLTSPKAVRYAWAGFPQYSLFSKDGIPASPFRFPVPVRDKTAGAKK